MELTFEQQTLREPSGMTPELKAVLTKLKIPLPPKVLIPETC